MAWYDAGLVNVTLNSATVTGVGTQWVAGARQGEAFVGPDGRLYEVLNIASNTSLTLTRPYRGATQAAQPYALAPFQGYVKELADRAAELLRRYSDALVLAEGSVQKTEIATKKYETMAGLLLTSDKAYGLGMHGLGTVSNYIGDYPTGYYSIASTALNGPPNVGGYQAAAEYTRINADRGVWLVTASGNTAATRKTFIGVLHGTTIAWKEVFTTENFNPAAKADLAALKTAAFADIIGDVGAGAVMQSGSNANGRWWRFQNGLQICTIHNLQRPFIDQGGPYVWSTRDRYWTFPLTFVGEAPTVSGFSGDGAGSAWVGMGGDVTGLTGASLRVFAGYSNTGEGRFSAMAIGRYK